MNSTMSSRRPANSNLSPLLRWAGSKRKLIPELLRQVPDQFDRYLEPFCGSACLFFALRPGRAVISDLNQDLIDTYRVLCAHPRKVFSAVSRMPDTEQFYYVLRKRASFELNDIDKAARFIYLNRNCFNGVYRTNRAGQFNVPRGTKVGEIPSGSHFLRCSIALRRAQLVAGDFEELVGNVIRGDFVYLDPPYAKLGSRRSGEYGYASFDTPDLVRLARCLDHIHQEGAVFLLSYALCPEIQEISGKWNHKIILVRRHVAGFQDRRAVVSEILISNRDLKR
jgi:DNA adenine methylase